MDNNNGELRRCGLNVFGFVPKAPVFFYDPVICLGENEMTNQQDYYCCNGSANNADADVFQRIAVCHFANEHRARGSASFTIASCDVYLIVYLNGYSFVACLNSFFCNKLANFADQIAEVWRSPRTQTQKDIQAGVFSKTIRMLSYLTFAWLSLTVNAKLRG